MSLGPDLVTNPSNAGATAQPSSQSIGQGAATTSQPTYQHATAVPASSGVPVVDNGISHMPYAAAQPYGGYGYGSYGGGYAGSYPAYGGGGPYGQAYGGTYGYAPYSRAAAVGAATSTTPSSHAVGATHSAGTSVLTSVQEAMTRFARVSALIDDVLRHLHMLFDAVFGLGYSLGAFHAEARLWLALKTGPVAALVRVVRAVASVWRLLTLFFLSPMAGRYSPVALVLRILGLVPDDAPNFPYGVASQTQVPDFSHPSDTQHGENQDDEYNRFVRERDTSNSNM